jgi:hypothetical protein
MIAEELSAEEEIADELSIAEEITESGALEIDVELLFGFSIVLCSPQETIKIEIQQINREAIIFFICHSPAILFKVPSIP